MKKITFLLFGKKAWVGIQNPDPLQDKTVDAASDPH